MNLWLPPSHQDNERLREQQLQANFARAEAPDLGDARACQKRLQGKDERLELCWGSAGPQRGRWVVVRNAEDGQRPIVHVFQTEQGEYARPEPDFADKLMNITGRRGDEFLKQLDREERLKDERREKGEQEFQERLAERVAHDITKIRGEKPSILVTKDIS